MIFNNMTRQEIQFYNFLINEDIKCNNSCYLNILYDVIPYDNKIHEDTLYQLLDTTYDHKTHVLASNSDILFTGFFSKFIGKYNDDFWLISENGDIIFLGNEVHQLPLILSSDIFEYYFDSNYDELQFSLVNKDCSIEDFKNLLHNYQNICKNNGWIFDLDWKYNKQKSEEFYNIFTILK